MVLNNLFAGQHWRKRHREQTYGHGERGGEGEIYGEMPGSSPSRIQGNPQDEQRR